MMSEKQTEKTDVYEKPAIEVLEIETTGILCGSGSPARVKNLNNGGGGRISEI